jgi:hypothetical protein
MFGPALDHRKFLEQPNTAVNVFHLDCKMLVADRLQKRTLRGRELGR